jgi:hypothetical protein
MAIPYWLGVLLRYVRPTFKPAGVVVTVPLPFVQPPEIQDMNLAAILAFLQSVNALLPEVVKLVQIVEAAFPNATVDAKLNQVISVLNGIQTVENDLTSPISAITSIITGLHSTVATDPAPKVAISTPSTAPAVATQSGGFGAVAAAISDVAGVVKAL